MHRDPKMALKMRGPTLEISNSTCTFTLNREDCIIQLAIMLVWGCGGDHCASAPSEIILEGDVEISL